MQGNMKNILLATCCLTLSACGGSSIDSPIFALNPTTPTDTDNSTNKLDFSKTQTFQISSVVLETAHDAVLNSSPWIVNSNRHVDHRVAGDEIDPTFVDITGNATMHYDTSDNGFSLTIDQGNTDFFHDFLESERDTSITDRLFYESILGNMLYYLDLSKPGTASRGHSALNYMSYGTWIARGYPVNVGGSRAVFGALAFGNETQNSDMPTSGSASYTGGAVGNLDEHYMGEILDNVAYQEDIAEALVSGSAAPDPNDYIKEVAFHQYYTVAYDVSITANFTANTLRAEFDNAVTAPEGSEPTYAGPSLDFHSSLSLTPGSNSFSGTASTNDTFLHGTLMGTFYGPTINGAPAEVGGIWALYDSAEQFWRLTGSFGAKLDE